MILKVVKFGHPALRKRGMRIESVTHAIETLIKDMFETMYAARGIGLAAQQVGEPLQLTVLDVRAATDRPSTLQIDGQERDPNQFMPLVLINPQIKPLGDVVAGPEGCLSFPEIYVDIRRPESVHVVATNEKGTRIEFTCGGLLARAIQHETDHLNGILFIDRMDAETKAGIKDEIDALQAETKSELKRQ
jgi:peptide deformylase